MKRKTLLLGIALSVLSLLCWVVTSQTMFLRCQSDSLVNISYLLIKKGSAFQRGDIVCLEGHKVKYVKEDKPLAKGVLGLPGDRIQQNKNFIRLIPQDKSLASLVLPLLLTTRKGEPLTPVSPSIIPEGFVFVAGNHSKSFDSRYKEFGLVLVEKIKGRALWWW